MYYSTQQALRAINSANPGRKGLTEDKIRWGIRSNKIARPDMMAGRFFWTENQVKAAAGALQRNPPNTTQLKAVEA